MRNVCPHPQCGQLLWGVWQRRRHAGVLAVLLYEGDLWGRTSLEFPTADFMFQLTPAEFRNLKSQLVISSWSGLRQAKSLFATVIDSSPGGAGWPNIRQTV